MPKAFPKEFREDVIRVLKNSDSSIAPVAKDVATSPPAGSAVNESDALWTGEGNLHVCAIKDVYSNRIVGYSIDSRISPGSLSRR